MHFIFEPSGELRGGIRLIGEIPDFKICHLEGRNGVGKTLALKLLELISGQQPYLTSPRAWESLRTNLGDTRLTIRGVDGFNLRVDLKPEGWPTDPKAVGEWLGEASLDGSPVTITSIASHFQIVRIAGDETFEVTIARRLETESAAIKRAHSVFIARLNQLEATLEEVKTETTVTDLELRDREQLLSVEEELRLADQSLRQLQEDSTLLEEALFARNQLRMLGDELPAVERRLREVEADRRRLEEQLRLAQDRQAALLSELARGSEVEEQFERVQQLRDKRARRLKSIANKVETAAARTSVAPDRETVAKALRQNQTNLEETERELIGSGRNASVRELIGKIGTALDEHQELDGETVIVLKGEGEIRVSAEELRAAILRREVELAEIEDDPLLKELYDRRSGLADRISTLEDLDGLLQKHERALELLAKSEAELAALIDQAQTTSELRAEYEGVASNVADIEADLRGQLAEEARFRVQVDQFGRGKSEEELAEQVETAVQQLDLGDEEALDSRYEAVTRESEELRVQLRQLRTSRVELQRSMALHESEIGKAAARLVRDYDWLPESVRDALLRPGDKEKAEALRALSNAIESVRDLFYRTRDRFDQFLTASEVLAGEVGKRERTTSEVELLDELASEMGDRIRDELNQKEIRNALFDGGELKVVDLRSLEVQWQTEKGEIRSRPLEAFSSGEQVFAYTRARIERVASLTARRKVVALDEFGAFLSRDRLERLASYLRDVVRRKLADQVVIVVPLAANYDLQAEVSGGDLGLRFRRRAAEIEARSYFAEDATERELV